MIHAQDNKWRVSVDGQLDIPFEVEEDAIKYAAYIESQGFECIVYRSIKPTNNQQEASNDQ